MMKRSLLTSIVALAAMTTLATGAARAAEAGDATLATSLEEGATYKISTVINGANYYLTSGGTLSTTESDADEFTFGTGTAGLYSSGFFSVINSAGSHATNPSGTSSSYEAGSNIRFTENRNRTWDTQVFFYDSSTDLYAVRATNVDSESQGWGPNTYWAVNTSDATAYYGTSAEFVWSITEVSAAPDYQVFSFDGSAWESYGSYGQGIGSQSTDQLAFDGSANTWGRIADDTYYYIPAGKALKITGTGFAEHTNNDPFVQWTIDGSTAKTSNSSIYRSDDGTTLIAPITVPSGASTVGVDGEEQYKCTLIDICFALTSGSAATVSSMEFIASGGTQCVGKEGTVAGESCIFPLSEDTYVSSVWYDTKNRTFEEKGFNTIIWPLDLSAEEIATRFGENAQAYEFTGVDGSTALFSTVSEMKAQYSLSAAKPRRGGFSTNYGRKIGAQIIPRKHGGRLYGERRRMELRGSVCLQHRDGARRSLRASGEQLRADRRGSRDVWRSRLPHQHLLRRSHARHSVRRKDYRRCSFSQGTVGGLPNVQRGWSARQPKLRGNNDKERTESGEVSSR